jgi:phosphoenolpyruvate-protein kinase (PTS system EI component)
VHGEYAVSTVMRKYAARFMAMKDRYMSERVKDIYDIEKRVLRKLVGQKRKDLAHLTQPVVVIAHDLLPSQTAALDKKFVVGFATDVGGRTAHTAIVARAMGIPAVVGPGQHHRRGLRRRHGHHRRHARRRDRQPRRRAARRTPRGRRRIKEADARLLAQSDLPAETKDGHALPCWRTSSSRKTSTTPSARAPRASACTAPSTSTSPATTSPARRTTTTPTPRRSSASTAGR